MIYIHIPYCRQKCTYCAFYSSPTRGDRTPYLEALCNELAMRSREQDHPVRTVYFGGGTPSMLTIDQLGTIIDSLRSHFDLSRMEEATLEANPEDLSEPYLRDLSRLRFFNRLSIGIQSFSDTDLSRLNRRHSGRQAIEAVEAAHRIGFHNISIDLIYGLPGQTTADWQRNLDILSAVEPHIAHLSCYALTLEEGTMLYRQIREGRIPPIDEDKQLAHYHQLQSWIATHGWQQYEISSYCRDGRRSLHNSRYWDATPYLGIGAGAHSFDGTRRRWNHPDIRAYIQALRDGTTYYDQEHLTQTDKVNEYLMTALRTTTGISWDHIRSCHPWAEADLRSKSARYLGTYLIDHGRHLTPTPEGLLHADGIAADLFF